MSTAEDEKYIPGSEIVGRVVDSVRSLGEQTAFFGNALGSTVDAVRRYPGEVLRLIAVLGMGTGALAVIGGTVVIVGFLTLTTGALIAVQGYNTLSNVGIEALTGFLGAFLNVRFIVPATAGVALAPPSVPAQPRSSGPCASTKRSTHWKRWPSGRSLTWRPPASWLEL